MTSFPRWAARRRGSFAIAVTFLGLSVHVGCGGSRAPVASGTGGAGAGASGGAAAAGGDGPDGGDPIPFQAASPATYVAKVKNLLVGLPPSDDEVQSVARDPAQLKLLIAGWMKLPSYEAKMRRFFELAFQQTQVSAIDFSDQTYPKPIAINVTSTPLLVQNARESFARTMMALVAAEQPLTSGVTTSQFMMTTALKELYAFLDVWQVDDSGKVTDGFKQANPAVKLTVGSAAGPIPIADTLDPQSANFMHWYDPDVATVGTTVPGCALDPIVYPANGQILHYLLYGSLDNYKNAAGISCPQTSGSAAAPQLTTADFADWHMVTIRRPAAGEAPTRFYDLPALRAATELVLSVPRVGFFSTPAFFANWPTNTSNQMRVTLNQALIVALGAQVDGSDRTIPAVNPPPGLDVTHASQAACAACHLTLDPLRSIFSATYSWNYHVQTDPVLVAQKGLFAFQGVVAPVSSIADLGALLASHPLFAEAWVQKLCSYANSAACVSADPELERVVAAFRASNHSWNVLVSELFSSPLLTNAAPTLTAQTNGEVIAVSRRDHLCAALSDRLGLDDVCGIDAVTRKQLQATVPQIALGLPSDGYGRGATAPILPNQPTLFYRAAVENMCASLAAQVIDVPVAKQVPGARAWTSLAPDDAIAEFVGTVMALVPSDARSAPVTAALKAHYQAAMGAGASPSDALKSTFVTACLAPSAVSIGL